MNPCEDCHRPVGVHCCHNCKKDANKCNEYHSCGACDAWEQGIFTNADRIRSMSNEELATILGDKCICPPTGECTRQYGDCIACWLDWLKQPAE